MSLSNFITELLELKEQNIKFNPKIEKLTKQNVHYQVICGTLSYIPEHCPKCGAVNEDLSIIKYGSKTCHIKLLPCNGMPTLLKLKKQRFFCKECRQTFSAKTDLVHPRCSISKQVKGKIFMELQRKISEKDIALSTYVSPSTVSRAIDLCYTQFTPDRDYLPKHLLFDANTHEIKDIVENRQLPFLKNYFRRYSKKARKNVETICIDLYNPYISLIKELFPKAKIVLDRFYIVQILSRAFNKTRIDIMNNDPTSSMEYKRLKRYWRLFLKAEVDLDRVHFKSFTHFNQKLSVKSVVEKSIAVDPKLSLCYQAFQTLLYDITSKKGERLKNT